MSYTIIKKQPITLSEEYKELQNTVQNEANARYFTGSYSNIVTVSFIYQVLTNVISTSIYNMDNFQNTLYT